MKGGNTGDDSTVCLKLCVRCCYTAAAAVVGLPGPARGVAGCAFELQTKSLSDMCTHSGRGHLWLSPREDLEVPLPSYRSC